MTQKNERKKILLVASLIFGMFFGAGNLIFPIQLGQLAGSNWLPATLGFLITGTLVPFLAMLAIGVTSSKGIYDIAKPVAPWFATAFLILVHLTLGPFFATPRTAATAYSMGISQLIGKQYQSLGMFVFSLCFFILAYLATVHRTNLTHWIGKYLNPIFLILIGTVLVITFTLPMGNLNQPVQAAYKNAAFFQGFLDGYNTMDGLGLLAFAVTIVYAVKGLGFADHHLPKTLAKAGLISIIAEAILYTGLVLMGVMSLGQLAIYPNGGETFAAIITHYTGSFGNILTSIVITLAVFTTAMGIISSFAQDLHRVLPKVSYVNWLRVTSIGSFITANAGLTNIVSWAVPVLMFLYPLVLTLILLSLTAKYFNHSALVYRITIAAVILPAIMDALTHLPLTQSSGMTQLTTTYYAIFPLANHGLGWVAPCLIGFVLAIMIQKLTNPIVTKDGSITG